MITQIEEDYTDYYIIIHDIKFVTGYAIRLLQTSWQAKMKVVIKV